MIRFCALSMIILPLACAAPESSETPDAGASALPLAPGVEVFSSFEDGAWVETRRRTHTYGEAGELVERVEELFDGSGWVVSDRTRWRWEGARLLEVLDESVQPDGTTWVPAWRTTYEWQDGVLTGAEDASFALDFSDVPNGLWSAQRLRTWERDGEGRVSRITTRWDLGEALPSVEVLTVVRDAQGRIEKLRHANGQEVTRFEHAITYDDQGRVGRILQTNEDEEPRVARATLAYAADGRGRQALVEVEGAEEGTFLPAERIFVDARADGTRVQVSELREGSAWVAESRLVATPTTEASHVTWTGDWSLGEGDLDEGLLYGTSPF